MWLLFPIEADEEFFASEVQFFPGKNGAGPAGVHEAGNLPTAEFGDGFWVRLIEAEEPALAEGDEASICEDGGAPSEHVGSFVAGSGFGVTAVGPTVVALPEDIAGFPLEAAEKGIGFVSSAESVEVAVDEVGLGPVHFEAEAAPGWGDAFSVWGDFEENGTVFEISGGEEDGVVVNDRRHGVDGGVLARAEPENEVAGSVIGVEGDESLAGDAEEVTFSVESGGHGGTVAGLFFEGGVVGVPLDGAFARPANHGGALPGFFATVFPEGFSGGGVEGCDGGVGLSANHDDEFAVFEDGGAANAEESFGDVEFGEGVPLPDAFSGGEVEAEEDAFGAVGIAVGFGEKGRAAGAVVVAERVDEAAGVGVFPEAFTGGGVETFDDFLRARAVVEDEAVGADAGRAVAGADLFFPEDGGAFGGEGLAEVGFWGGVVTVGTEELGPVGALDEGEEERGEEVKKREAHGEGGIFGC